MKTHDYIEMEEQYGAHNYHPLDVVITRGQGVWVYDVEGKRYLDCLSAYSALVLSATTSCRYSTKNYLK